MKKIVLIITLLPALTGLSSADLGIMDTVSESTAKLGLSSLGVSQVYDHPSTIPTGEMFIPVYYNRTNAEGNGAETVPNDSSKSDVDYVPASQMKGVAGAPGVSGTGGKEGKDGKDGRNGTDATIDNHLFLNIGFGIRWYDWKHIALTSGYKYDVRHYNHTVDLAVVQVKLGQSYEERRLEALNRKLEALESNLAVMQIIEDR